VNFILKIEFRNSSVHSIIFLPIYFLGYVPVVNRGQKDIQNTKSIKKALDDEKQFFESHPAYSSKAQYCGTPFLARKLNLVITFLLFFLKIFKKKTKNFKDFNASYS